MDRLITYPGATPLETDILSTNKNTMIGLAKLSQALLGSSTLLNGLACAPTSPASMQVAVAAGEIYAMANIDGTAYSSIAADTTHTILKQGISLDVTNLSCPAPGTAGQSINYLVQVTYQDTDATLVTLPYYNASNPAQAYSGPNNTGVAQNTARKGQCVIAVKTGIAATTGSQVTPAADSGYVGAWVVTVAYGAATIVAGNISQYSAAPFIGGNLLQKANIPTIANISTMTALAPTSLVNDQQVIVSGYTTHGDGGGGVFYWDSASTATADGGTVFSASAGGTGRWKRIYSGSINAKWFGAVGDGVTDDITALNAALAYLNSIGGGILTLSYPHAISASLVNSYDYVRVEGVSRSSATLKALSNNIDLYKHAASYGGISNVKFDANSKTGVRGLVVAPVSEVQTTTVVNQNFNRFSNLWISGTTEGIYMRCGPDVATVDSGCWYNVFDGIHILSCTRGILLDNGPNASSSGVNRNQFYSIRIGQTGCNTGIEIKSGGTNEFHGCAWEGILSGTSPNTTPTAVKIAAAGTYSGNNDSNRFFGGSFEANTRDIDNADPYTEFYGCNPADAKCLFTAEPTVLLGYNPSQIRQILPGYHYQANGQKAGVDNNSIWADGANGFSSPSFDVIDLGGTANPRGRTSESFIGAIAAAGSATTTIIPAVKLNPTLVNVISGTLTFEAIDGSNNPIYAEWRVMVRLTAGPTLGNWGQLKIYETTSIGANDWRAATAGLTISALVVTAGALRVTIADASVAVTQAMVRFDYQQNQF